MGRKKKKRPNLELLAAEAEKALAPEPEPDYTLACQWCGEDVWEVSREALDASIGEQGIHLDPKELRPTKKRTRQGAMVPHSDYPVHTDCVPIDCPFCGDFVFEARASGGFSTYLNKIVKGKRLERYPSITRRAFGIRIRRPFELSRGSDLARRRGLAG